MKPTGDTSDSSTQPDASVRITRPAGLVDPGKGIYNGYRRQAYDSIAHDRPGAILLTAGWHYRLYDSNSTLQRGRGTCGRR